MKYRIYKRFEDIPESKEEAGRLSIVVWKKFRLDYTVDLEDRDDFSIEWFNDEKEKEAMFYYIIKDREFWEKVEIKRKSRKLKEFEKSIEFFSSRQMESANEEEVEKNFYTLSRFIV